MPTFFYRALDRSGKEISGQVTQANKAEVVEQLKMRGLFPINVAAESAEGWFAQLTGVFSNTASVKQLCLFTRQLAVLLRSSVPIDDAIMLLVEQNTGFFKKALSSIKENLQEGKALATALEQYPMLFSNVYVHLVRAGEASGNLERVLDKLADSMDRSQEVQDKVSGALSYPIFMLIVILGVIIFSSTVIVPSVADTLADLGGKVPFITAIMLGISDILLYYWYLLIAGFGGIGLAIFFWQRSERGSLQLDTLLLKTPLVEKFVKVRAVVQFTQTLGMLLDAGINFSEALDLVSRVVANKILSRTLLEARSNIIKEGKIAKHLEKTAIFPPIAHYMIKVGEETGQLPAMLLRVGNDYQEELFRTTDTLVAAISPIMTILTAAVVLFVVLSIFMPILEMSNVGQLSGM